MALSKKDFEAIAAILSRYTFDSIGRGIADELSDYFMDTNPNFKVEQFWLAAGMAEVRRTDGSNG